MYVTKSGLVVNERLDHFTKRKNYLKTYSVGLWFHSMTTNGYEKSSI